MLVATKCDKQSPDGRFQTSFGNYDIHRTSPDSPQTQKMCIAVILRDVFRQRDGKCKEPELPELAVAPDIWIPCIVRRRGKEGEREQEKVSGFGHAALSLYTTRII